MQKIKFEKNIFPIKNSVYNYVDMHVHTEYSSDCCMPAKKIIEHAKKLNIGVAVTDHNEIDGAVEAYKYAKKLNVLVIPGIEVHCAEGTHIVFYFYNTKELKKFYKEVISPNKTKDPFERIKLSFSDILEKRNHYECLVSAPHPYVKAFVGLRAIKNKKNYWQNFDLIEVLNSCVRRKANLKAFKQAKNKNLGMVGGSDAHLMFEIGLSLTKTKGCNVHDFLSELKNGKSTVVGKESNFGKTLCVALVKEFRLFKNCLKNHNLLFRLKVMLMTFLPYSSSKIDFKIPQPKTK
ncbi:PHP domain-containing protein [Candidatus Pacearchaeota archaeon]|nr:PHP domain-containing protein [Candidatus Pacearchaeota archaeon]